eukprot:g44363.t1
MSAGDETKDMAAAILQNKTHLVQVTFLKKESRLKQVAELKGLGERFLSLSVGAKYRIGTRVQVELCNPGDVALFRPGRTNEKGEQLRRAGISVRRGRS